jgi:hypothetical protein
MPDFGGGYQSDRSAGGNGFGSSGRGGPGNVGGADTHGNNSQRNSLFGYNPRTGRVVQVGAPSRLNGMLTTAAGYNLNRAADMARGGLGLTGFGIHDPRSPFNQGYVANRQKNIRTWAADRQGAYDAAYDSIFSDPNASWDSKVRDLTDLKSGLLGALEERGRDMSGMRATHNAGPWGAMFGPGTTADDVETMAETEDKLNGATDLGYASLGFLGSVAAPGVGQKLSEITRSPIAGVVGSTLTNRTAKTVGPNVSKAVNGGLMGAGFLGVPGTTQLGQMYGLMNKAANLNYAGYTAGPNAPNSKADYGDGGLRWPLWIKQS